MGPFEHLSYPARTLQLPCDSQARTQALEAIWERERLTGGYQPTWLPVQTDSISVVGLTFMVNPTHPQYAGRLSLPQQAQFINQATGQLGSCRDYLENTMTSLAASGIQDTFLDRLRAAVRTNSSHQGQVRHQG